MGGFTQKLKNKAKDKVKNKVKKKITGKLATFGLALTVKIIPTLLIAVTAASIVDFVVEIFTADNTPKEIYEQLEIEDVAELIQIKGNQEDGYYLDFIDDIDKKLDSLIETLNTSSEYHNVPKDKKFLKKLLKAEAVTKFPNLGGKIPEGSEGFQGAIDIKRVTPNKEVGAMVNTGKDDTNILEQEPSYNDSQMTPREEQIKKWEEGKEIVLINDAVVYEKIKNKWGEVKYEDSKKVVKIKKSSKVKYTGKYEVSRDKLNDTTVIYVEVKGKNTRDEDITGYIRSSQINLRSTEENTQDISNWKEGKEILLKKDEVNAYTKIDGVWTEKMKEGTIIPLKIKNSDKITYAGKYEEYKNELLPATEIIYVYVNVGEKDKAYIRLSDINLEKSTEEKKKTTSRGNEKDEKKKEKITVGGDKKEYVVAIAAGHNNTDDIGAESPDKELHEEELTIKVAEKVEELVKERYSNVKVVQTGSTSANPGGIKMEERTKLARDTKPDLCIQIHFDISEDPEATGVQAIYKEQDEISQQLAEILSRNISQEMGLYNRGAGTDVERTQVKNLGIIESAAITNFPSVVTEGGFLSNSNDKSIIKDGGTDKYAEGIVKGIKEYLEADHSGRTAHSPGETTETPSIESKIRKMKYVPLEEFEKLKESSVEEAIKYFSLNEDNKLVTLSWNMKKDGTIEIKENSPMDFRTALQKYHMPYEYLLYYYIDTDYKAFSEKLADIVLDSEIVIALQDNVSTVETSVQKQKLVTVSGENPPIDKATNGWQNVGTVENSKTESVRTKIDITYIETWCVKVYQANSYSKNILNMGDKEEIIVNAPGKVTETKDEKTLEEKVVDGKAMGDYSYIEYERTSSTTHTISNSYDSGGDMKVDGITNKYVDLYIKEQMNKKIKEDWLFLILENNERIKQANLVDLTKYLMFLASNTDYGVTEFNFEEFFKKSFSNAGGLYGNSIQEKVWFAVLGAGYSKEAAAGVLGNIEAESGFDPSVIEGGSGIGFGLCQWSFGRRTQLEQYAESKGKEPGDVNTQIKFLIGEITPGGGADGFANYQLMNYNGYSPEDWENATTPEDAAEAFCWTFERPGIPRMEVRTEAARRYYEEFKDKEKPSGGNILEVCEEVMNDMISRNVHYSTENLIWKDIEASLNHPYACCATYVSIVLYKSGLLTEDQINAYNYHYTGSGGVPDMLAAAGWTKVSHDEAQPGDVINDVGTHVMIYAGGNLIYDECCGVVSSDGNPPIGAPYENWNNYKGKDSVQVWRAP